MNRIIVPFAALCFACSGGTSSSAAASTPAQTAADRTGTVHLVASDTWVVVPDGDDTARYCFNGPLAEPLRSEGKKVKFSGDVGPIPPNVRLACSPFTFSAVSSLPVGG